MESNSSATKMFIGTVWIVSVIVSAFIGYMIGQGNRSQQAATPSNVLITDSTQSTVTPIYTPQVSPTLANTNVCTKAGLSQKWEYLTPYVIKEGDTLQAIATTQLNDASRVSEILQLNGVGPLVVGTTLYLPPTIIPKSSGNIAQVSGRLVEKDTNNWHISFNGDINGQGLFLPSFWFGEIKDKDAFKIGDCVTILFDDGFKVYSVSLQK